MIRGNKGPGTCNLGAEVTFGGSRGIVFEISTPIALGRRPIPQHAKTSKTIPLEHAELAPEPLSIGPWALHLRCLRHLPPRACVVAADAAAIPSSERPPSWISMLLLWLLITWLWKRHALHAAVLRRWANLLHVGDSRHLVMSPSEALAKLLTDHDHCCYGLVLQL